jgi:hypothetical protein
MGVISGYRVQFKNGRGLSLREFHRNSFSLCRSTPKLRRAQSPSMKDSKRIASKLLQWSTNCRGWVLHGQKWEKDYGTLHDLLSPCAFIDVNRIILDISTWRTS